MPADAYDMRIMASHPKEDWARKPPCTVHRKEGRKEGRKERVRGAVSAEPRRDYLALGGPPAGLTDCVGLRRRRRRKRRGGRRRASHQTQEGRNSTRLPRSDDETESRGAHHVARSVGHQKGGGREGGSSNTDRYFLIVPPATPTRSRLSNEVI